MTSIIANGGFSVDVIKFTSGPPGLVFVPFRQRIRLRTHRPALLPQYLPDCTTGHAPAELSAVCSKSERFSDIRASTGPADFRSLFDFAASEIEVPGKRQHEVLEQVLGGRSDANIAFGDLLNLLCTLGFSERKRGSHRIFWKSDVIEIINLQPKGSKAKPYQVRQVRKILLKYSLGPNDV